MLAQHREALVAAAVAGSVAALLVWLGPPGTDFAAHAYGRALFLRHGFVLWDNYWYAGRYSFIGYSVLYYPLAAVLGIRLLAVLGAAVAAVAFAELVGGNWGAAARWASRAFAVVWGGYVLTGAFPFALGVSFALLALWALQARRRWLFALCVFLTLAASPVALVLLGVVLAGLAVACGWQLVPAVVVGAAAVAEIVVLRLFPGGGHYAFPVSEAVSALAFCAVGLGCTWRVGEARVLRAVFAAYAVAVVAVWIVPSDLGENIARLRYVAFPVVLLVFALRRWRPAPVAVLVAVAALAWNVTPLVAGWNRGADDVTKSAAVWRAPLTWLHAHLRTGYRVEAVDTTAHWPAYYLPESGIPIVRGWFRQKDFPTNAILYRSFTASEYVVWLHTLGVEYVVLSDAPTDYSSRREAAIVRTALRRVYASPHITIYAVPRARGITGARVLAFGGSSLTVRTERAGAYRIAVHWSPYWHASAGTLARSSDGMLELTTRGAETVRLTFSFG
ncbi:MAG TPA: hypothetical protein VGH79_11435 [Gaiellaceae bacterium]|jgi:hypothetical protein